MRSEQTEADGERRHRRRAMLLVGIAVVLALVALVVVPRVSDMVVSRYRPEARPGESLGLDVSHYQGSIDWEAVAADDISFVYIKATEGGDWVDDTFATNWEGARAAGLEVGAYHFFTLCRTGADQAANFLETVPMDADLPAAIDLEFPMNCSDRPEPERVRAEVQVFLETVEDATGREVLLYVEDRFDEQYEILGAFDNATWVRSLREVPDGDRWVIWQANDAADVDGVETPVDLNLMAESCCS